MQDFLFARTLVAKSTTTPTPPLLPRFKNQLPHYRPRKRIFEGLEIFFVKKRQIRTQIKILMQKIEERGGLVNETRIDSTTHVVYSKGAEEREIIGDSALHVRIEWLSECIEHDSLVSCDLVSAFFTNDTNCNDKRTRDMLSQRGYK